MDGVSYLLFGGVFTANMTGNTVLLGLAVGRLAGADVVRAAVALAGFAVGALCGSRPRQARVVFGAELVALAVAAALAGLSSHLPAIIAAAAAMGLQTAGLRVRNPTGVKVTYLTGTVTAFWARVARADDDGESPVFPLAVWCTYLVGAVVAALVARPLGGITLLAPMLAIAGAGVVTRTREPHP